MLRITESNYRWRSPGIIVMLETPTILRNAQPFLFDPKKTPIPCIDTKESKVKLKALPLVSETLAVSASAATTI